MVETSHVHKCSVLNAGHRGPIYGLFVYFWSSFLGKAQKLDHCAKSSNNLTTTIWITGTKLSWLRASSNQTVSVQSLKHGTINKKSTANKNSFITEPEMAFQKRQKFLHLEDRWQKKYLFLGSISLPSSEDQVSAPRM